MKKSKNPSQYRQIRLAAGLSPELLEELRVLKSLEATQAPQPTQN